MEKGIQIIIDQDTYSKLLEISIKKGVAVVDEISYLFKKHIDNEKEKLNEVKEGKQYLCEG